jgi:hypothetical protein
MFKLFAPSVSFMFGLLGMKGEGGKPGVFHMS